MKISIKGFVLGLMIAGLLATATAAQADPVGDFFKRLGNSISNAGNRHPARRTTAKNSSKQAGAKDSNTQPDEKKPNAADTAASSPSQTPATSVRAATAVPAVKGKKRDVPYGIPVPGKQGFVTSPFAPDEGYVDVRSFPPGTEVKDPYTGKIFLTP